MTIRIGDTLESIMDELGKVESIGFVVEMASFDKDKHQILDMYGMQLGQIIQDYGNKVKQIIEKNEGEIKRAFAVMDAIEKRGTKKDPSFSSLGGEHEGSKGGSSRSEVVYRLAQAAR